MITVKSKHVNTNTKLLNKIEHSIPRPTLRRSTPGIGNDLLRETPHIHRNIFINDIHGTAAGQKTSNVDVKTLVEMLHTTDDTELLAKLFLILAINLVENDTGKDDIIMSNCLYDKIHNVLSKGQPIKTAQTLNFVSALLYLDEEAASRAASLALRARHALRTSGCLLIMCNLFANSMLHQETWSALCRCLAECCRDCHENQSYCSHLVPLCVHKCIQNNMEAVITLKSLINNNVCNLKLYFECNGLSIFNRKEALLHTSTMQLLDVVVQHSSTEKLLLLQDTIIENLQYYRQMYGTQTKIGEWAAVILYHINSRMKDIKGFNLKENCHINFTKNKEFIPEVGFPKPDDTVKLLQNVIEEIHQYNKNNYFDHKSAVDNISDKLKKCMRKDNYSQNGSVFKENVSTIGSNTVEKGGHFDKSSNNQPIITNTSSSKPYHVFNDDTAILLQNVFREVYQNNEKINLNRKSTVDGVMKKAKQANRSNYSKNGRNAKIDKMYTRKYCTKEENSEHTFNKTSFSFLLKQHLQDSSTKLLKNNMSHISHSTEESLGTVSNSNLKPWNPRNNYFLQHKRPSDNLMACNNDDDPSLLDFKPIFVSTPKRSNKNGSSSLKCAQKHKTLSKSCKRREIFTKNEKSKKGKDLKQRSISSRLFDAINDSCTTVVKTFKSIFKTQPSLVKVNDKERICATKDDLQLSCSYSFTNYMRKREALLSNESSSLHSEKKLSKFCKTCNDTISLKCKVTNNTHLKETLSKLKVGINLYGCDFKRISRVIWPHDRYMTPEVLYNLYRKLIIK